jgi:hypothetical protein
MYDDSDFTFSSMCCTCGGGQGTLAPTLTPAPSLAATLSASRCFISVYGEGAASNKWLVITNGGMTEEDLSAYAIWMIFNGRDWYENSISLSGALAAGDSYLIAQTNADSALRDVADLTNSSVSWNGDDAIGLAYAGTLIDAVGEAGDDPGSGWDVCGMSSATKDKTLVRKPGISIGNLNWTASAGIDADDCEWRVFDLGVFFAPTSAPTSPTPAPSRGASDAPASLPSLQPTTSPSPPPTRTPGLVLNLGLSGIACDSYGSIEEQIINAALSDIVSGTSFSDHICSDANATHRRHRRRLDAESSVSISVEMKLAGAADGLANATNTLNAAVSAGALTSSISSLASSSSATSLYGVAVESASVDMFTPSVAPSAFPTTQTPTSTRGIYISTYGEGSWNNRWLELTNGGVVSVDLSECELWMSWNGGANLWSDYESGSGGTRISLSGTLMAGASYLIANANASSALASAADLLSSSFGHWDGDDAIGLALSHVLVDAVGDDTGDPGDGWTVCGTADATKDHTLVRKSSIARGSTDWVLSAGTDASDCEWVVLDADVWFAPTATPTSATPTLAAPTPTPTVTAPSALPSPAPSAPTAPPSATRSLFISIYGDGSRNNKWLELSNGNAADADLAQCAIGIIRNGASSSMSSIVLSGSLSSGETFVCILDFTCVVLRPDRRCAVVLCYCAGT